MSVIFKPVVFCILRAIYLALVAGFLAGSQSVAQDNESTDPIHGLWYGSDGLTYSIALKNDTDISITPTGEDAQPSVVPSFSPPQITATAPTMLNGLTLDGLYRPDGFEVAALLAEFENFNFHPKSVSLGVRLALTNSYPDLSSRIDVAMLSAHKMQLTRHIIRLKWQQKDPPVLIEVTEKASIQEILLTRAPCAIQTLSFRSAADSKTGRTKFKYRHIRTDIRRADANGNFAEDAGVSIDMTSSKPPVAGMKKLYENLLAAEGLTMHQLLNADPSAGADNRSGTSEHSFGCDTGYRCVKVGELDPHGNLFPTETIRSTAADQRTIITGINRIVKLPNKGDHLVTFLIRFQGKLEQFRGVCVPEQ
ncbi:hypothetical protein ROA7450_01092 [Roseovarius albus]|uniref:Uncharacterized protein n=1 Tax=Roseovarius albus TaxID=1247867 RepID=A0A1X6YNM1_9RHOB|nr:hypothetical protein [Roseovarius albus]SLN26121.1 hypothetical protein ROA7450_01092 [Roseovarius albus]